MRQLSARQRWRLRSSEKLRKTEHAEHSPTIFGCKDYREKQLTLPARSLPADSCFQSVW
jgi:hypothetical protein